MDADNVEVSHVADDKGVQTLDTTNTSTATTQTDDVAASTSASAPKDTALPQKNDFHSLSTDLKSLILSYIIRPSDLKNVCLVSKQLHSLAVRYLYRSIDLELGSPSDSCLAALISPNNIGLKHVKHLRLYLAPAENACAASQHAKQAEFATRMLLEFLPENMLEEFSWCPWLPFAAENLLLLFKKQKRLKWLEVMNLDRPILSDLQTNPKLEENLYSNTRMLALYPENRDTLQLSGRFLEKTSPVLEELVLHAHFDIDDGSELTARELADSATGPGLITSTVFAHLMPFDSCKPLANLTALRLHKISLRQCADTWCKVISFTQIKCLRLFHCIGTDTLLDNLCRAAHLPKKLRQLEIQQRDNTENELLLALDGFLCLVSGLESLSLDLQNVKVLPAAAGIVRHGKTLEILNIHASNDSTLPVVGDTTSADELVFSAEDFDKICSGMLKLEQLSCAWPSSSMLRDPDEHWQSFLSSARKMRDLVTLHVTTWPGVSGVIVISRIIYETLMKELARTLFDKFHSPAPVVEEFVTTAADADATQAPAVEEKPSRLNLIAFGINERIHDRENSKDQLLYLRSKAFDAEGKPEMHAAPVGWCARQFLEPRSEVVDFVLGREAHMPVKNDGDIVGDRRFGGVWDHDVQLELVW